MIDNELSNYLYDRPGVDQACGRPGARALERESPFSKYPCCTADQEQSKVVFNLFY